MGPGVDRAIIRIIGRGGIVTPSRIPVASVPVIPATADQDDVVAVVRVPPIPLMPLRAIGLEDAILWAAPVVGVLDSVVLVELGTGDRLVRSRFEVPVLGADVLHVGRVLLFIYHGLLVFLDRRILIRLNRGRLIVLDGGHLVLLNGRMLLLQRLRICDNGVVRL